MPLALVIFGDKSHTDLHGSLSLTPIIFTLTLFNRDARNDARFWRPLGYIPNLSHGKGDADSTKSVSKVQDEHICLATVLQSITSINNNGGMKFNFQGNDVCAKVWIHFFIGDTEGNNKWLGQYNSSNQGVMMPYRDCKCRHDDLDKTKLKCDYMSLDDISKAHSAALLEPSNKTDIFKQISKHPIINALTQDNLPLSDLIYGPYRMMPPELLHTSGSGLIMYMFGSLKDQVTSQKKREGLDTLHQKMSYHLTRQSDRDLPRRSIRNGILDSTKSQSSERKGNLLCLLCIAHTTDGGMLLKEEVWERQVAIDTEHDEDVNQDKRFCKVISIRNRWIEFLKLYLSMEEWFHDENDKMEVEHSCDLIARVLTDLKYLFPRLGNGYKIPKFHGMAKMTYYMQLFGSAMNFYGGPGESHHKTFVKGPGQQTQRRVSEFATQVAERTYEDLIFRHIESQSGTRVSELEQIDNDNDGNDEFYNGTGRYTLTIGDTVDDYDVLWKTDNERKKRDVNSQEKYNLHPDFIKVIMREIEGKRIGLPTILNGFTRLAITNTQGTRSSFVANPSYQGGAWYDWGLVSFWESNKSGEEEESLYPSQILGFIEMIDDENGREQCAVVRCSTLPINWSDVQKKFILKCKLGEDFNLSYVTVPVSSIVHPLITFPDYGGDSGSQYFIVLPKRNWSRYFGDKIKIKA